MFDDFLETKFITYIKSSYNITLKAHTSIEDVLKLLVDAITSLKITNAKVRIE